MAVVLAPRRRRVSPGALYVTSATGACIALLVLAGSGAVTPLAVLPVVALLGPLGIVGAALGVAILTSIAAALNGDVPLPVIDGVVLVTVIVVAGLNVLVLAAVRRGAIDPRASVDRTVGGAAFLTAGFAFFVLCIMAGFLALVAGGIDAPTPAAHAALVRTTAAVVWGTAAAVAVAGLVLWNVRARRKARLLPSAILDLAVQTAAIAVLLAVGS